MGVYLNPKNAGFTDAVRSEIYVDKTGLIKYTKPAARIVQPTKMPIHEDIIFFILV